MKQSCLSFSRIVLKEMIDGVDFGWLAIPPPVTAAQIEFSRERNDFRLTGELKVHMTESKGRTHISTRSLNHAIAQNRKKNHSKFACLSPILHFFEEHRIMI